MIDARGDDQNGTEDLMRNKTADTVISASGVTIRNSPVVVGDKCVVPPRVNVIRQGHDVAAIEIQCGCGESIVLDCSYMSGDSGGPD